MVDRFFKSLPYVLNDKRWGRKGVTKSRNNFGTGTN
jgi:hypothetical protein